MTAEIDEAAVRLAIHELLAHPAMADAVVSRGNGEMILDVSCALGFGSRWLAAGESPFGVRPSEPVRFTFSRTYPRSAPKVTLRPDFRRDHPHVQPWLEDGRVVPCLVDGRVSEFVASRGLYALADQLKAWLLKAATGELMDLAQGWEPTRRDDVEDWLEASADALRRLVEAKGGYALLETTYLHRDDAVFSSFYGALGARTNAKTKFSTGASNDGRWQYGSGFALVVWPGSNPGKQPKVSAAYLSETVSDAASLWARARDLGVDDALTNGVKLLQTTRRDRKKAAYPLPILMLVRRPVKLIGTGSDIEILPYLTRFTMPEPLLSLASDQVRPLSHLEERSQDLLRRVSGAPESSPWALLGCGSLGSKIALHGARSGVAPALVADTARMSPHNAARHALYPAGEGRADWSGPKAELLARACRGLCGGTVAIEGDQRSLWSAIAGIHSKAERPRVLLNTTASLVAREDLCRDGRPQGVRVAEATLYGKGALAMIAVEDPTLNPDVGELHSQLFAAAGRDEGLAPLFGQGLDRVAIGQGCGSMTMTMSDARLSTMAAFVAERLFEAEDGLFPPGLQVFLREGAGTRAVAIPTTPCIRTPLEGLEGWSISVPEPLAARIEAQRAVHDPVETGGVLVGWTSAIAKRVYVADLLDAPPDSVRSRSEFVLGVDGLTAQLEMLSLSTGGALACVGTWHSHSGSASPSGLDQFRRQSSVRLSCGPWRC